MDCTRCSLSSQERFRGLALGYYRERNYLYHWSFRTTGLASHRMIPPAEEGEPIVQRRRRNITRRDISGGNANLREETLWESGLGCLWGA